MDLGIVLRETAETGIVERAERAEEAGFESVWKGELWGENVLVQLAEIAAATDRVRLGPAIVNVFSRSPAVIAMGAASLDRIAGGRLALGVGVSSPTAIEDVHGLEFERPIRRTHEAVELLRGFLGRGDDRVDYDGEVFSVADVPALSAEAPIYNAALGPANRRVTGRLCDGWMPNNVPISRLGDAFETVAKAAREAGRDPDAVEVAPWIHVAASDDPEEARDAIRGVVAYYVGSSDGYRNSVGAAFPEEADRIAEAWRAGDREEARGLVTDEMVADLGCAGTPRRAREALRAAVEDRPAVDLPIVHTPPQADDALVERTFEAVAPLASEP